VFVPPKRLIARVSEIDSPKSSTAPIYLSTLAGYIEALGGKLEIRAVFPDREIRITQFEEFNRRGRYQ
jgi:hypothetical protein